MHLEIGRPDFDTPTLVKEAATASLAAGRVHYGPNAGTPQLRTAIARTLAAASGPVYDPDGEVIVTIGASEAVFLAIMAFCGPGDEVLIPVPAWPAYEACVRLAGATPVFLPLDPAQGYSLDPEAVRARLTPRTRMLVVCTPHNPTGAVVDAGRLRALADVLRHTGVLVLSDEIYSELVYDGTRHVPVATVADLHMRTLTVGGFAKAYAMDGWRLGWLAAPRELATPALRIRQFTTACPPTFTQDAAVSALRDTAQERAQMRDAFAERRRAALDLLNGCTGLHIGNPAGAFYLYLTYPPHLGPGDRFARELLEEDHVAVVPGAAFDPTGAGAHSLRVSYARSVDDIREGVSRILRRIDRLSDGGRR
ncbi:aminotransferase [Sinosporangium siamense]|uniref:Aminotransferase n=1 Tax=Sinosporangium siamense TaxID=1367973 RepID=A0A919RNX1_9ACTN|nr:aminotransferase [Sinosporangium siamense]